MLDLDAPQLKGVTTITAKPEIAAIRGIDLDALRRGEIGIESKLSSEKGGPLLALLGLDRAIAAGDGPLQFEGSAAGVWGSPLRLKAALSGAGLDAEAQGTSELWAAEKANVNLKVRSVNLAPLFGLKPSDALAQNINLSSHLSLAGNKLMFEDLDSVIAGSRLRGRMALTLDEARTVEGEVGLDALDLAPVVCMAIGSAGHDAGEPLDAGLLKGWRGRIAFQALRGVLPGGVELRPVSGAVKSDGQSLTFDSLKGGIGGGEASATIDVKQGANGIALNARAQLAGVDGAALHYRGLAMPGGRASMQMTLASQGRSASALIGRAVRKRHCDAGVRPHLRPRSARLRGCDPRQRRWSGDRRRQAAANRRSGAVGRCVAGRVGAGPIQCQGWPASRRGNHAGCRGRARHPVRRLRYSRRSGRHSREPCFDFGTGRRPSGDSIVRGRLARRARPHG